MSQHKSKAGWIKSAFKRYLIDCMSAMALGLFSSLIIGVVIAQLAKIPALNWLQPFADMVSATSPVVGAAIGVAIAYTLKVKPLAMFSSAATGALGYSLGGPVGAYLAAIAGAELGNLVAGRTPVDIVLVPIVTIVTGGLTGMFVGPPINSFMLALGNFINTATTLQPVSMSIVVSVVVGLALSGPISSAALCISLGLEGFAAGAACAGCAAHMVGFAVASYRENKVGGLLSQGLGTSKLQLGNIMRKPIIVLPAVITSAILGPIATVVFEMTNNPMGAGMGTSSLVGQFGAWTAMSNQGRSGIVIIGIILLLHFILPAIIAFLISEFFRKKGWIKFGDMKLEL